jgi:hypothetical protein
VPSLLGPLRDQRLISARQAAQLCHCLRLRTVLLALGLACAEHDPGDLGQQVGTAVRYLPELGYRGDGLVLVQGAPPGMPLGGAGEPGHNQAVSSRAGTIMCHLVRIEHKIDKRKSAEPMSCVVPICASVRALGQAPKEFRPCWVT